MLSQDIIFQGWRYRTQFWMRDIKIRTKMTTSAWVDMLSTVSARGASIFDKVMAEYPAGEFLRRVSEFQENEPHSYLDGSSRASIMR
jgi:hypothetical protein